MHQVLIFTLFSSLSFANTLRGMHDTIGGIQSNGFENIEKMSSSKLDLFSSDFGFSIHPNDDFRKRDELLNKMIKLSDKISFFTLSYHQCRPDIKEPCTFKTGVADVNFSDKEWDELLKENSPLNLKWQKQMQKLADFLAKLQQKKITVYFRPYHEMNIPNFWWTNIQNPKRHIELWKMTYAFMKEKNKLSNLKWVWSISYHPKYLANLKAFYPGSAYVDVISVDIYPPEKKKSPNFENAWDLLNEIDASKPKALSEISKLPDLSILKKREWLYVVPWGETMLRNENTIDEIKTFYSTK